MSQEGHELAESARQLVQVSTFLDKPQLQLGQQLLEASKRLMRDKVKGMVQDKLFSPMLLSYQADGTPKKIKVVIPCKANNYDAEPFVRCGFQKEDLYLQRAFLSSLIVQGQPKVFPFS